MVEYKEKLLMEWVINKPWVTLGNSGSLTDGCYFEKLEARKEPQVKCKRTKKKRPNRRRELEKHRARYHWKSLEIDCAQKKRKKMRNFWGFWKVTEWNTVPKSVIPLETTTTNTKSNILKVGSRKYQRPYWRVNISRNFVGLSEKKEKKEWRKFQKIFLFKKYRALK